MRENFSVHFFSVFGNEHIYLSLSIFFSGGWCLRMNLHHLFLWKSYNLWIKYWHQFIISIVKLLCKYSEEMWPFGFLWCSGVYRLFNCIIWIIFSIFTLTRWWIMSCFGTFPNEYLRAHIIFILNTDNIYDVDKLWNIYALCEILDSNKESNLKNIPLLYFQHNRINLPNHALNFYHTCYNMCGVITSYQVAWNTPLCI